MHRSRSVICAGLAIVGLCSMPMSAHPDQREPLCRLEVLLTTTPNLSYAARASMMEEAAAIWGHHGVAIDWLPATATRPVSQDRLRVLVVERRQSVQPRETTTIAELLRFSTGHPVAIVSIERAERLVASVNSRTGNDLAAVTERRLGLVLGRALAHEIGHYILDTHTHASDGLMRPHFNALEFTDLRDGAFELDRTASEWLKSRSPNDRFAYSR